MSSTLETGLAALCDVPVAADGVQSCRGQARLGLLPVAFFVALALAVALALTLIVVLLRFLRALCARFVPRRACRAVTPG